MHNNLLEKTKFNLGAIAIYLHSTDSRCCNNFNPMQHSKDITTSQNKIGTSYVEQIPGDSGDIKIIRYVVEAGLRYLTAPEDIDIDIEEQVSPYIAAEILASFVADYSITGDLDHEAIVEYGHKNAPFDVYPYWREYCQSMCNRMMLPITILPIVSDPDKLPIAKVS